MHLIKETICQRQKFSSELAFRPSTDGATLQELRTRLQALLKEKKLQSTRQVRQSLYVQTILSQKVTSSDDVKQFNELSKDLLSLYSEQFREELMNLQVSKDLVNSSIFLFVRFFEVTGNSSRAAEAMNMFQKRLCEKDAMLPTLLSWFVEWTRKSYLAEMKQALQQLNTAIEALQPKLNPPTKQTKQEPQQQQARQQQGRMGEQVRMVRSDTIAQLTSQLSKELDLEDERFIINKELFYGSFPNEMAECYRFYGEAIDDLDVGYLKPLKKVDNRKEIIKNIPKVVDMFISSMQFMTRKSIDSFMISYQLKYPDHIHKVQKLQKEREKAQRLKKKRSQSPKKEYCNLLSGNSETLKPNKASTSISKLQYMSEERPSHNEGESPKKGMVQIRELLGRPLLTKKFVDINLPSIKSRSSNENPEGKEEFKESSPNIIYPQWYARNHGFQIREEMIYKPFADAARQEERRARQRRSKERDRYASLQKEEPKLSFENFTFGRKSNRLEDLIGQVPETESHIFCLPRLVKN